MEVVGILDHAMLGNASQHAHHLLVEAVGAAHMSLACNGSVHAEGVSTLLHIPAETGISSACLRACPHTELEIIQDKVKLGLNPAVVRASASSTESSPVCLT